MTSTFRADPQMRATFYRSLYSLPWLLMLSPGLVEVLTTHSERRGIGLLMLATFAGTYSWFWIRGICDGHPNAVAVSASVIAGFTFLFPLAFGPGWVFAPFFAPALVGMGARPRTAGVVLSAFTLAAGLDFMQIGGIQLADVVSFVLEFALLSMCMVGVRYLIATVSKLREAQDEIGRLAVADERARFARDLHDLLGHSLSVIALKSELAGRVMQSDPQRAANEILEVERVARQSLREVREAVSGLREASLDDEIQSARNTLTAAGIALHVEPPGTDLPRVAETVLAWAVREGITNVIRHGRARSCTIRVRKDARTAAVEVVNDGPPARSAATNGNGLRGLAERVSARNGELEAAPMSEGGFRLHVSIPLEPA